VLVAGATVAVLRSDAAWPLKATVVAFGSVLMVPYVLAYDLAIPFAALIWCLRTNALRSDIAGAAFIGALWALPFGLGILAQTQGVPLLPLVLMAAFAWLVAEALDWRGYTLRFHAKA
jgi:alpha-1,2-mannosyltransferase